MTDSSIPGAPMSYALIRYQRDPDHNRRGWLDLESFARATGTHPDLVTRFVALGLLDPERDRAGALWFAPDQLARLARMQRLRAAFSVNYAALGLVLDLLDRVDQLERALRRSQRQPWR
ncbi:MULTISPECIES: chaperone modulator CbpM [Actinomycetes]|uniref:MerR-like DNA binding protein n=6 Tax=Pseudonocardiaceae TaxID=2070 RepID=A0A2N3X143_9PSEU|nr:MULTISPECIES: chaperone modulator CbpM [Actinomycetes]MBF6189386.1 MerR family transcriptional regulator [Nocardia farcinica]MBF6295617.1 MerR family transcriptional regulator [Nocardia farcinica]MBF6313359.1 MerR family transcriptional regulator [Nocardia farcinica]MBF6375424.1 MerR family transcriptional regulator [Nocardia farcinica]MBF6382181.1 MerR family transcriptional regulator [Nocardia farcinica]